MHSFTPRRGVPGRGYWAMIRPLPLTWILMACGFVRIARKLRRLKRERAVRE